MVITKRSRKTQTTKEINQKSRKGEKKDTSPPARSVEPGSTNSSCGAPRVQGPASTGSARGMRARCLSMQSHARPSLLGWTWRVLVSSGHRHRGGEEYVLDSDALDLKARFKSATSLRRGRNARRARPSSRGARRDPPLQAHRHAACKTSCKASCKASCNFAMSLHGAATTEIINRGL